MKEQIDDGGPAFPSGKSEKRGYENSHPLHEGLTMRDWFAGQALNGLCANNNVHGYSANFGWALVNCGTPDLAGYCLQLADAMIAARSKQEADAKPTESVNAELLEALKELRDAPWLNLPGRAGDIVQAAIDKAEAAK